MITVEEILNAFKDCVFEELTEYNYHNLIISKIQFPVKFKYNNGVTKLVIIPENEDFVIKIPLSGICEEDEFEYFSGVDSGDYCLEEATNYKVAKDFCVERFFAKTEYIGSVHGHPIYKQERVATIFEDSKDSRHYHRKDTRDRCSKLGVNCFHACWIEDFLKYYTEEDLIRLDSFLTDYCIGDLHGGNLGYYEDGRPVIFDYSDFHD